MLTAVWTQLKTKTYQRAENVSIEGFRVSYQITLAVFVEVSKQQQCPVRYILKLNIPDHRFSTMK